MVPGIEPDSTQPDGGFTLIELLVCVAILAVLAAAASLALSRGSSPGQRDMALFQAQFEASRRQAIAGQQSRGLAISPRGLQQLRRDAGGWQPPGLLQRWQGRTAFAPRRARLLPAPAGPGVPPGQPEIVFLADGRTSAFRISFGSSLSCESNGWTGLQCAGG